MAAKVTTPCRVSWNYGVHELAAGQLIPDGEFADHLLATGAPVERVEAEQAEPKRRARRSEN